MGGRRGRRMKSPPGWLSAEEAANFVGISKPAFYAMAKAVHLRYEIARGMHFYRESDVVTMMQLRGENR